MFINLRDPVNKLVIVRVCRNQLKSHNGDCPFCDTSELIAQTGTKLTFLTNASLDESA